MPRGGRSSSTAPGGSAKPSSFQWMSGGAGRQGAQHGIAVGGRQRGELRPGEVPALELADLTAVRVREQLRAEADAEHRDAARRRVAEQRGLARETGLERVLLAAQHHDPVVLADLGQRVAVAREALVELRAGTAQRGAGVAEERALEVVDDGDPGGHPAPRLPPRSVRLLGLNTKMCSH